MDAGRKCTRYFAEGHYSVRPLGASWKGHDYAPKAASNRKISVIDEQHDAPQEIRPEEAEALHGFDRGTTAASNVTAKERLQCLGGGYDINVVRLLLRPLASQQPDLAYLTECETRRLRENITEQEVFEAKTWHALSESDPDVVTELLNDYSVPEQARALALTATYYNILQASEQEGSVIDSGASKHVTPLTIITDADDRTELRSFTGEKKWTDGHGYVPLKLQDSENHEQFDIDVTGTDRYQGKNSLLSLVLLLKAGWKFNLESADECYAYTPTGHTVKLDTSNNQLRIKHQVRKGKAAAPQPVHAVTTRHAEEAPADFLHRLLIHSNGAKVHRTLGVTKGFVQPETPLPDCKCNACAQARARKKPLRQTSYEVTSIFAVDSADDSQASDTDLDEEFHDPDTSDYGESTDSRDEEIDALSSEGDDDAELPADDMSELDFTWKAPVAKLTSPFPKSYAQR